VPNLPRAVLREFCKETPVFVQDRVAKTVTTPSPVASSAWGFGAGLAVRCHRTGRRPQSKQQRSAAQRERSYWKPADSSDLRDCLPQSLFPKDTPTSCSWVSAVEGFFDKLTRRRKRAGIIAAMFSSIVELQAAINRFLARPTTTPSPSPGPEIPVKSSTV